jgi:hypothetical protein
MRLGAEGWEGKVGEGREMGPLLFLGAERWVREGGRRQGGVTLVVCHANGFHKEVSLGDQGAYNLLTLLDVPPDPQTATRPRPNFLPLFIRQRPSPIYVFVITYAARARNAHRRDLAPRRRPSWGFCRLECGSYRARPFVDGWREGYHQFR